MAILVFIIILGFLVFIHELGHFVAARLGGIKTDEFGFGFPPRIAGIVKSDESGKWKLVVGNKEVRSTNTIYSINWIPIGGFVKIKGENGEGKQETDSFASKSAWVRIGVLLAGVTMNFVFTWILFSAGFMIGVPQEVEDVSAPGSMIFIDRVVENSPAQTIGLKPGDVIEEKQQAQDGTIIELKTVAEVQDFISQSKGRDISLSIVRGDEKLKLEGAVRSEAPEGEGLLGIGLAQVANVRFGFFASLWEGAKETGNVFMLIFQTFGKLLVGENAGVEIMGPIKIASVAGQVVPLGLAFILRFAAILSINLGIINALPFPALDGGRVLFILIEKIKGSPVSQKLEQTMHSIGMTLLLLLMLVITIRELLGLKFFQ